MLGRLGWLDDLIGAPVQKEYGLLMSAELLLALTGLYLVLVAGIVVLMKTRREFDL